MYITCQKLAEAGIVPKYNVCCGSCHADAEDEYDWEMCGIYESDVVEGGEFYKLVGSVCCGVRNAFSNDDPRVLELLKKD